jgi:hypothetical protein
MKRRALKRRYGRASFITLPPGMKVKLAVMKTPAGTCRFEVIDQYGNDRGFIEYAKEGFRFSVPDGFIKGPWVKTKAQAMSGFKKFQGGKS